MHVAGDGVARHYLGLRQVVGDLQVQQLIQRVTSRHQSFGMFILERLGTSSAVTGSNNDIVRSDDAFEKQFLLSCTLRSQNHI